MFDNIGTTINTGLNNLVDAWFNKQTAAVTAQTMPAPVVSNDAPKTATIFGLSPLMVGMLTAAAVGLVIVSRT